MRGGVGAVAGQRQADDRDGAVPRQLGRRLRGDGAVGERAAARAAAMAACDGGRRRVGGLDDGLGVRLLGRERRVDAVVGLQHRERVAGQVGDARRLGVHAERREGERGQHGDAGDQGDERAAHHMAEHEAPHAGVALLALHARAAAAGGSCGRGRRASPARPAAPSASRARRRRRRGSSRSAIAAESASPMKNRPPSDATTVMPETSTAWPLVAAAASSAASLPAPRRALLALPLEVEQRVVDADRHADQHHQDRARRRRSG